MGFTMDNQTLLIIMIVLFVLQFLIMRYYVQSTIEENNHKNNKKIIKRLTEQISTTFDQYMGGDPRHTNVQQAPGQYLRTSGVSRQQNYGEKERSRKTEDVDSIEDPAEHIDEEVRQNETDE